MMVNRNPRTTVAIVGLGSIGSVVTACLRDADAHDVLVCGRRNQARLVVELPEGNAIDVSLRVQTDPAGAPVVDWVLLCTKAHDTESTAPWLANLCGPATRVAVLQNGIGHVQRVAPFVGPATVVPTIVYYNGERLAEDRARFRHATTYDLAVEDEAGGRAFAQLFEGTPLRVLVSAAFTTLAWRKLLLNIAANPITALTLQRQAVLRRDDVRKLCLAVFDEAVAVARAEGIDLEVDEPARALQTLMSYPKEAGTSMYFDRLAGRRLEAETLTGPIVEAGERHGIPTPINRAFLTLLCAIGDAPTGAVSGERWARAPRRLQ